MPGTQYDIRNTQYGILQPDTQLAFTLGAQYPHKIARLEVFIALLLSILGLCKQFAAFGNQQ
jgi:hypothetical protein